MTSDLLDLLPSPKTLTIAGEDILIRHFRFKQLTEVADPVGILARKFIALADELDSAPRRSVPSNPELSPEEIAEIEIQIRAEVIRERMTRIAVLLLENGSEVSKILCVSTGKPQSWMDEREVDEVIELVLALIEVNRDFFFQRLAPAIKKVAENLSSGLK